MISASPHEVLFDQTNSDHQPDITVAISCYNYQVEIIEALTSLTQQQGIQFDVVVVDDASKDASAFVVRRWLEHQGDHANFRRVRLIRHTPNQGLPKSRNTAIALAESPFIFILDADNLLYPRALRQMQTALVNSHCEMAYSLIEGFGAGPSLRGSEIWLAELFTFGNYIDAMSLIRKDALEAVGGYRVMPITGWEDFDLWCAFVDRGFRGCYVPEILCRYREHATSMLRTITDKSDHREVLREDMRQTHPNIPFQFLDVH